MIQDNGKELIEKMDKVGQVETGKEDSAIKLKKSEKGRWKLYLSSYLEKYYLSKQRSEEKLISSSLERRIKKMKGEKQYNCFFCRYRL